MNDPVRELLRSMMDFELAKKMQRAKENERLRVAFEIEEKRAGQYLPADREHLYDDHGANVQAIYDTGECDGMAWLAHRLRKAMEGK